MGSRFRRRLLRGQPFGVPRNLSPVGGRLNAFGPCTTCGGYFTTVDVDSGAVPTQFRCHANAPDVGMLVCDGVCPSQGYPGGVGKPPWPATVGVVPWWEWYRPQGAELAEVSARRDAVARHVRRGGLLLRRRRFGDRPG